MAHTPEIELDARPVPYIPPIPPTSVLSQASPAPLIAGQLVRSSKVTRECK